LSTPQSGGSAVARGAARVILVVAGITLAIGLALIILFGFTGAGPGFVVLGLILMVIFGFLEPESLRAFLGQGELQAGTKAIAQAVLVVGAVILLNMVVRDRLADTKLDLSKGQINTLAPQTVSVLKSLDSPVQVTVWYGQQASEQDTAFNLLKQYHNVNSNLVVQRYSVIERPTLAQQQKVTQADSVVFVYKNRAPEVTTATTEQDFTTSLLRLSTGKSPKAYFLAGHGEGDINTASQSGNSFTALKAALDKQGITSATLNLATGSGGTLTTPGVPSLNASPAPAASAPASPTAVASPSPSASGSPSALQATAVPADADEVVILDPVAALSPNELAALDDYLAKGGHLLVSSPPLGKSNLATLVSKYGISFGGGIVLDKQLHYSQSSAAEVLLISSFGQSPVTRGLDTLPVLLLGATSVDGKAATGYTETPLISSAGDACARTDLTVTDPNCLAADKKGPFTLAATLEQTSAPAGTRPVRIVAFGGAGFADDLVASQTTQPPGNVPLMVNAINWLAGQDKVINIAPRTATPEAVFLTDAQRQLILIGYPFFLPALVGALGVSVYLRRRQRG
jgi:ABC-type uncharacterized transport system involved in gliding motility auxiliary subunit